MDAQTKGDAPVADAELLEKLAAWINTEYTEIERANTTAKEVRRNIVERAIILGRRLNEAKEKVGHGSWLSWLTLRCRDVAERTAQQYMDLAKNETKLRKEMKSASNADLTLAQAFRLIKNPGGGDELNASDKYDRAQKSLINKLRAFNKPEDAEAAASNTIKELETTVAAIKAEAFDAAKPKAA